MASHPSPGKLRQRRKNRPPATKTPMTASSRSNANPTAGYFSSTSSGTAWTARLTYTSPSGWIMKLDGRAGSIVPTRPGAASIGRRSRRSSLRCDIPRRARRIGADRGLRPDEPTDPVYDRLIPEVMRVKCSCVSSSRACHQRCSGVASGV